MYTNDLPDCIQGAETILFADDTTIYQSSENIQMLYANMNTNLEYLNDWFKANKLSLNISKPNYVLFGNKIDNDLAHELNISNIIIKRVRSTKFLGIFIDEKLKWDVHIDSIKSRIASSLYIMNKVKHIVPHSLLRTLYYSMIHPYLTYGIILWGATYQCQMSKLQIMQKKAVRCIDGAKYNAHSEPIFKKHSIVKLDDVYKLYIAKFIISYLRYELPQPLQKMFLPDNDLHGHNTRQNEK